MCFCVFASEFLRFVIQQKGIKIDKNKAKTILNSKE